MDVFMELSDAVVDMDEDRAVLIANQILDEKLSIMKAIEIGLVGGMARVGDLFEAEEYFIPELLMCSDAMYAALHVLEPHIKKEEEKEKYTIVIGSITGDTHDIGKNIVSLFLSSAGYEVIDIGRDASKENFVDAAVLHNADIIAISTLMTTTMQNMKGVIDLLTERNLRSRFKVIVGGRPVSKAFADRIGADGYSANAAGALRLVKNLLESKMRDRV